jgi:hypothetical protein
MFSVPHLVFHRLRLVLAGLIVSAPLWAAKADKPEKIDKAEKLAALAEAAPERPAKREALGSDNTAKQRDQAGPNSRTMTRLRERMEIKDDAEWQVIYERIARVEESKRGLNLNLRPTPNQNAEKSRRGNSATPERDSLREAVNDKLPDAEVKSRLAQAHRVYLQREQALALAQADLRAVLTIQQEAVAVLFGILTP